MEWQAIEDVYAIKPDARERVEMLTDQVPASLDRTAAGFVHDVVSDLMAVFAHSKDTGELVSSTLVVLTQNDRGIIFGTIVVIISLSLLSMQGSATEPKKIGDAE